MYCLKCGHELSDDASFCPACGTEQPKKAAVESPPPVPVPEPVVAAPAPVAVPEPVVAAPIPVAAPEPPAPAAAPEPPVAAPIPVAAQAAPAAAPAPVAPPAPAPAKKKSGAKWAIIGGVGALVLIALLVVGAILILKSLQKNPIASTYDAINKFGNQQKSGLTVEVSGQTVRGNWILGNSFDDSYFYLDAGSGNKAGVHNGEAGIVSNNDYYQFYNLRDALDEALSGSDIDLSYSDLNALIKNGKIDQDAATKLSQKLSSQQSGSTSSLGLTTDQENLVKELSDGKKSQQLIDDFIHKECKKKAVQDKFLSEVSQSKSGGVTTIQYTLDLKAFVMAFYDYAVNSKTLSESARNALKKTYEDSKGQIDNTIGGATIKVGISVSIASDGNLDELKIKNIPGLEGDITLRRDKNALDTGTVDSLIKDAKDNYNSFGGYSF